MTETNKKVRVSQQLGRIQQLGTEGSTSLLPHQGQLVPGTREVVLFLGVLLTPEVEARVNRNELTVQTLALKWNHLPTAMPQSWRP